MKKALSLVLALMLVVALAACGGTADSSVPAADEPASVAADEPASVADDAAEPAADNSDIHVAFVVKSLSDQFYVLMKAGAEQAAAEAGIELTFVAPNSESDVQGQVDMIQNLLGQDIDAICIAPSSDDAVQPVLEQAEAAGIKVLAVDTDTSYPGKLTFIGTGNTAAAKLGGEYVVEKLGEGKNAIILRGRLGDQNHDEREAGWVEGLEAGGYTILEVQAADSEAEKGMNVTQNLLTKYDNIDVICCTADSMAQGAQRAVEAAGKLDTISVMGFDGTLPVCEMTIDGLFLGSVAQDPFNMGVVGVQEGIKAAKGETIEARIDTGAIIVGQDNAQDFLDELNARLGN